MKTECLLDLYFFSGFFDVHMYLLYIDTTKNSSPVLRKELSFYGFSNIMLRQSYSVLIGNSNNKLSQQDWSSFIEEIDNVINEYTNSIHFAGGSSPEKPWQNYCWVFDEAIPMLEHSKTSELFSKISKIRQEYNQDSVAIAQTTYTFV